MHLSVWEAKTRHWTHETDLPVIHGKRTKKKEKVEQGENILVTT